MKNTLSETFEITIAVSIALNHLNLVVAAFGDVLDKMSAVIMDT